MNKIKLLSSLLLVLFCSFVFAQKRIPLVKLNTQNVTIIENTQLFFEYFPNYPVIRIKQNPYEFYIAPTDNCIHDGSTLNTNSLDIVMTYLGHFKSQQ